jgi:hypothetical protein
MEEQDTPLSLVLFSGTTDKLTAAAVLAVGAAAMGRPVNVFLQYHALDAFRAGRVCLDHGLAPDATAEQAARVRGHVGQHWSDLLRQARAVRAPEGDFRPWDEIDAWVETIAGQLGGERPAPAQEDRLVGLPSARDLLE